MKPLFCFIDDTDFELDNFRRFAAPSFNRADFVYAKTFEHAKHLLKGRLPLCFMLDLYGTDPSVSDPHIPAESDLAARLGGPLNLHDIYQDLSGQGAELGNLFLRRLWAQLESWQQTFRYAAEALGQGVGYGLANLRAVRTAYPWAAAVGYSRKTMFIDAVKVCQAGADGLLQKPQGREEAEIAKATLQAASELAGIAYQAVERRLGNLAATIGLKSVISGRVSALSDDLIEALRHLGVKGVGSPKAPLKEVQRALLSHADANDGLEPNERALLRALAEWLGTLPSPSDSMAGDEA